MQQKTGLVEAIIVEIQDRSKIGGSYLHSDAICCTPELDKEKFCRVGEVIIQPNPDNPDWPKRVQTFFNGRDEEANMVTQVSINKTGMYYLYFMSCDPQLKGLKITGRTVWRNPQGYLPGLELVENLGNINDFSGKTRFAYSEETADEADEEGLSLVGSAVKGTGDMVNMHVFSEDKRA
ncbi:hypothetical protein E2562_023766 [Oryza meyeriana var. granulata]|uniref:Uncharacterized protein n=1 Tax=Oryza meyeriana var. granulata TaxID=110450 RepID=A0A6G1DME2_9ORYZ|nr:hypothetical protein E2562_023766 [Oryza meyeriana var. granulata]